MAQVIVRNIEDYVREGLKLQAIEHGWSMEEEVRQILSRAVGARSETRLGSRIASRFTGDGLTEPLAELRGQSIEPLSFGV
ncbi:MAG: plasmid stabilization protein [Rhodoferax sp.]|nr:plasmid stabilization protein [Rhodoferax sp.]